ncbi:MAG: hypothetical protein ACREEM_36765 [Blastocatellia bacterium]
MNCTADNSINRHYNIRSFALALLLGELALTALAAPRAAVQPTGVRNSSGPQRLNEKQLQQAQESLRHKSGLVELGFDEQGALVLGNRQHIRGGSATARALLIAAVDSRNLYELESHERSPEVAFARIYESEDRLIAETGQRLTIYQVQIDFADFSRLSGAREAKAAFDIGIALLHELVHGVLKLPDPQSADQIGDCDAHVNQMRRELQLPERLYYQPGITVVRSSDGRGIVCARLEFVERQAGQAEPSAKYQLTWLPSQVSPNAQNIAGLQQGLLASKRR